MFTSWNSVYWELTKEVASRLNGVHYREYSYEQILDIVQEKVLSDPLAENYNLLGPRKLAHWVDEIISEFGGG